MDYKEAIEKYGVDMLEELLDYVVIGGNPPWLHFAKKYRIVGNSTRTVRGRIFRVGLISKTHVVHMYNGRNQMKFQLRIRDEDLEKVREEINHAKTNPNHE